MTTHLFVLGTRRPDSDEAYQAYVGAAGPLLFGAGGVINGQYQTTTQVVGDGGPQNILIMDFPDEDAIRRVFDSAEYANAIPDRDAAFEQITVVVAAAAS